MPRRHLRFEGCRVLPLMMPAVSTCGVYSDKRARMLLLVLPPSRFCRREEITSVAVAAADVLLAAFPLLLVERSRIFPLLPPHLLAT